MLLGASPFPPQMLKRFRDTLLVTRIIQRSLDAANHGCDRFTRGGEFGRGGIEKVSADAVTGSVPECCIQKFRLDRERRDVPPGFVQCGGDESAREGGEESS